MSGTLQATPWNIAPYGTLGSFTSPPNALFGGFGPPQNLLQQLQFLPQQLQNVQQTAYLQHQVLQQVVQALQIVPHQIQQLQQLVQFLPQQVAQLVQQALTQSSIGLPGVSGLGAAAPFGGVALGQPLHSLGFGSFPSIQPMTSTPFGTGQPGYVM
ncbi:MAG TPA: hypothetical protein VF424_11230 [Vicinamibacterales bacterium]